MSSMVSGVFGPSKSEKRAMREMEQQRPSNRPSSTPRRRD